MCVKCQKLASDLPQHADAPDAFQQLIDKGNQLQQLSPEALRKAVANDPQEESGGEDFLPYELLLAGLLGLAFKNVGEEVLPQMYAELDARGIRGLGKAIEEVTPEFSNVFTHADTEAKVTSAIEGSIVAGSAMAGDAKLAGELFRAKAILEDMVQASKYYTNTYFNRMVVPQLQSIVQEALLTGQLDSTTYQAIREAMSNRLKSVPYWRVVANAAASRGYHYGAIRAGQALGRRGYQILAVLDSRTSDICLFMNGKQFWVADAAIQVTRAAEAEGEDIKSVAPWLPIEDIQDLTNDELRQRGFIIPPLHPNCRSTIKFID